MKMPIDLLKLWNRDCAKMLRLVGVLILAGVLAGCGGGGKDDPSENDNNGGDNGGDANTQVFDPESYFRKQGKITGILEGLNEGGRVRVALTTKDGNVENLELEQNGAFSFTASYPVSTMYRVDIEAVAGDQNCFDKSKAQRSVYRTVGLADSGELEIACIRPLPKPTFNLDSTLVPVLEKSVDEFGNVYTVGSLFSGEDGSQNDLVTRKLLVMTTDRPVLESLLARWNGEVLKTLKLPEESNLGSLYMVRISSPNTPSTVDLGAFLQQATPVATGEFLASDQNVLETLQFAAEANQKGMKVNLSWLMTPTTIETGTVEDSSSGPTSGGFSPDAFRQETMRTEGIYRTGVADAWRAMAVSGRLSRSVSMLIVDGGFRDLGDYPSATTIFNENVANPMDCGGSPCPWHGTAVASVAAAQVDNRTGIAGTGGPVIANLRLLGTPGFDLLEIGEFIFGLLQEILSTGLGVGPDIVNISAAVRLPASLAVATNALIDPLTALVYARGVFIVAAAGNSGENVDEEDCFGPCWEAATWTPCENSYVFCVGGMNSGRFGSVHPVSNYGVNRYGTVDLHAPFNLFIPDLATSGALNTPEVRLGSGTSYSSPFVAGVAALVLRALEPVAGASDVTTLLGAGVVQSMAIEGFLKGTANVMYGIRDYSVNAHAAVVSAMEISGADVSSRIFIDAPDGTRMSWRGRGIALRAYAYDPKLEDEISISWYDQDGNLLSTGANILLDSSEWPIGDHVLEARDTAGDEQPTATITISVVNDPPSVEIVPLDKLGYCTGEVINARALIEDPNNPDGFPESSVQWEAVSTVSDARQVLGTGPTVSSSLPEGTWQLVVAATDEFGAVGTATSQDIEVAVCVDQPPQIEILTPADGSEFNAGDTITFTVRATDAEDGDLSANVSWTTNRPEQHPGELLDNAYLYLLHQQYGHPIGEGASIQTQLAITNDGSPHIIKATVTDSYGNTSSVTILVYVNVVII